MVSQENNQKNKQEDKQEGGDQSHRRALVLFSGGQDSSVALIWALENYAMVETVGFEYGQRNIVELSCRKNVLSKLRGQSDKWSARLGEDHLVDLSVLGEISDSALTREREILFTEQGLPNTFVPGRNLIFFSFAAALAYRRGIDTLVGGMCEADFSGYPDCRADTLKALQASLSLGMDTDFKIETPLMALDKSQSWQLAEQLGGSTLVELIRVETHTCYLGERDTLHHWGYGCGGCPACILRQRGYQAYIDGC